MDELVVPSALALAWAAEEGPRRIHNNNNNNNNNDDDDDDNNNNETTTTMRKPSAVTVNPSTISEATQRPRAADARKMNARMRKTTIGAPAPSSATGPEDPRP